MITKPDGIVAKLGKKYSPNLDEIEEQSKRINEVWNNPGAEAFMKRNIKAIKGAFKLLKEDQDRIDRNMRSKVKYELDREDKILIQSIKDQWKTIKGRIFCDKRKTFYRVKLYMVTKRDANKAKKIAESLGVNAIVEKMIIKPHWALPGDYYNCIIKYKNM